MAKKQGKIKSIPVTNVIEGMQVLTPYEVGIIIENNSNSLKEYTIKRKDGGLVFYSKNKLKTLVVEYEEDLTNHNIDSHNWCSRCNNSIFHKSEHKLKLFTIPLKYSQWQNAIDNGEVDSDKVVEFEIIENKGYLICSHCKNPYDCSPTDGKCIICRKSGLSELIKGLSIAKIIPQKKRMYS